MLTFNRMIGRRESSVWLKTQNTMGQNEKEILSCVIFMHLRLIFMTYKIYLFKNNESPYYRNA